MLRISYLKSSSPIKLSIRSFILALGLIFIISFFNSDDQAIASSATSSSFKYPTATLDRALELYKKLPPPNEDFSSFPRANRLALRDFSDEQPESEHFYILEKFGSTWRSSSGPSFFAVESDPTWALSILGPELAYYFGFALLSESLLQVPKPNYLIERIQILNTALTELHFEPISLNFYLQTPKSRKSLLGSKRDFRFSYAESYVKRVVQGDLFPISIREIIHDLTHHFMNILWTRDQQRPLWARGNVLIAFLDSYRQLDSSRTPKVQIPQPVKEILIELMYQYFSRDIDNLSGGIPIVILKHRRQVEEEIKLLQNPSSFRAPRSIFSYFENLLFGSNPQSVFQNHQESFFRLGLLHLGESISETSNHRKSVATPHVNYHVSDWLQSFVERRIIPVIKSPDSEMKRSSCAEYFIKNWRKKNRFDLVEINKTQIKESLLYSLNDFFTTMPDPDDLLIARYDKNFNVAAGLASPDFYITSFERRIQELNEAATLITDFRE